MNAETLGTGAARQLSRGSASVALGLGVFGIATFVYLGVVGRNLGWADYAPRFTVAWLDLVLIALSGRLWAGEHL